MAAPGKFENKNKRFWNSFIPDTNDFFEKIKNRLYNLFYVV